MSSYRSVAGKDVVLIRTSDMPIPPPCFILFDEGLWVSVSAFCKDGDGFRVLRSDRAEERQHWWNVRGERGCLAVCLVRVSDGKPGRRRVVLQEKRWMEPMDMTKPLCKLV